MARVHCGIKAPRIAVQSKRLSLHPCYSSKPDNNNSGYVYQRRTRTRTRTRTPKILKLAVTGVTELLRLFSSSSSSSNSRNSLDSVDDKDKEEISVSGVDDIVTILKSDYENAYFVTGVFTSAIYADDCLFEDPTIRFRGKALYSNNLKLLVPFFDSPSIGLQKIEKGVDSKANSVLATWKLRTYLKLPWKPLICIEGNTVYELDENLNIVRHAESWNVSALEAIGQIFTPSFGRPND